MKNELLPKDVKAYLIQAAAEIAKEQGFCPDTLEQSNEWLRANTRAIGQRALDLQHKLLNKLCAETGYYRGTRAKVAAIIAAKVWEEVNVREVRRRANRACSDALAVAA